METKAIIGIVFLVAVVGFILYRCVLQDWIKGRWSKKQSDSNEPKEK